MKVNDHKEAGDVEERYCYIVFTVYVRGQQFWNRRHIFPGRRCAYFRCKTLSTLGSDLMLDFYVCLAVCLERLCTSSLLTVTAHHVILRAPTGARWADLKRCINRMRIGMSHGVRTRSFFMWLFDNYDGCDLTIHFFLKFISYHDSTHTDFLYPHSPGRFNLKVDLKKKITSFESTPYRAPSLYSLH